MGFGQLHRVTEIVSISATEIQSSRKYYIRLIINGRYDYITGKRGVQHLALDGSRLLR